MLDFVLVARLQLLTRCTCIWQLMTILRTGSYPSGRMECVGFVVRGGWDYGCFTVDQLSASSPYCCRRLHRRWFEWSHCHLFWQVRNNSLIHVHTTLVLIATLTQVHAQWVVYLGLGVHVHFCLIFAPYFVTHYHVHLNPGTLVCHWTISLASGSLQYWASLLVLLLLLWRFTPDKKLLHFSPQWKLHRTEQ